VDVLDVPPSVAPETVGNDGIEGRELHQDLEHRAASGEVPEALLDKMMIALREITVRHVVSDPLDDLERLLVEVVDLPEVNVIGAHKLPLIIEDTDADDGGADVPAVDH
jgi:hypothetical protein